MRHNTVRVLAKRAGKFRPAERTFPLWPAERDDLLAEDETRTGRPTWEEQLGRPEATPSERHRRRVTSELRGAGAASRWRDACRNP